MSISNSSVDGLGIACAVRRPTRSRLVSIARVVGLAGAHRSQPPGHRVDDRPGSRSAVRTAASNVTRSSERLISVAASRAA